MSAPLNGMIDRFLDDIQERVQVRKLKDRALAGRAMSLQDVLWIGDNVHAELYERLR